MYFLKMYSLKANMAGAAATAIFLGVSAPIPQASAAEFEASPVTSGFWTWPRSKPKDAAEIAAACHASMAIVLADGRYLGVAREMVPAGDRRPLWLLTERGQCRFDRSRQNERCDLTVLENGGTSSSGYMTTTYQRDGDGSLKGTVEVVGDRGDEERRARKLRDLSNPLSRRRRVRGVAVDRRKAVMPVVECGLLHRYEMAVIRSPRRRG